jgi:transketolase N-terminal domain/subunit
MLWIRRMSYFCHIQGSQLTPIATTFRLQVCIMEAFFESEKTKDQFIPILFDEAGHRVATQYFLSAVHGQIPYEHLLYYRAANSKLPGHPELGLTPGVKFSSGRLGHMWPL